MPHQTGEMAPPAELVQQLRDNNIRAVKMFPRLHRFPFTVDICGPLLAELENNGIPLLLEGGNLYYNDVLEQWNQVLVTELDAVLSSFPNLPVILQGARWDATRFIHWLMSKHRNLHMDFSSHQGNRALEVFTEWFGVERLLFGTGALDKSAGAAKSFVDYCTLSNEQKAAIAGGNLARLLRVEKLPAPYKAKRVADPILAAARQGKPLRDTLVIDAHAHLNHEGAAGIGFMHSAHSDAASMVERAKTMGIDQMCISSFLAVWTDYEEGNRITYRAMQQFPRFYRGYAALQPQYITDWKRACDTVHRRYRMGGLKPYHPRTFMAYNDPLWKPWYEYGNRIRGHVLVHPSPDVVAEVNDLAPKYPDLTWIIAHSGASYAEARKGIDIALKNPNVVLEITLTSVTYGVIEFMVKHLGADRVLFGTDQPMRDPIPQFGWVVYSHCTPAEKRKILGLNMQKILRRVRF
jgi:predicted TIM-barrel fold metal-dependent hydrolase